MAAMVRAVDLFYPFLTMPTREELKALIDQMPESRLDAVRSMLEHHLHPPTPLPGTEQIRDRSHRYKQQVMKKFEETRRPGTLGGLGGTSSLGNHAGVPFGRQCFQYWEDKALVFQTLQSFDGQEVEIMERLAFSPDRTTLVLNLELSSGGHTVQHEDGFPISRPGSQE